MIEEQQKQIDDIIKDAKKYADMQADNEEIVNKNLAEIDPSSDLFKFMKESLKTAKSGTLDVSSFIKNFKNLNDGR